MANTSRFKCKAAKVYPEPGVIVQKLAPAIITKYYKRLIDSFKSVDYIAFQFLPGKRGLWVREGKRTYILLDPRESLLPTLIHELLHNYYEDLTEMEVLSLEFSLVNKLSPRRYKKINKLLMTKLK